MRGSARPFVPAPRALSEIGRRREQAIRRAAIPVWYWWATAVLTIALSAAVEAGRGRGVLPWIGIALFTVGTLVISGLLSRALRGAPPRRDLTGASRAKPIKASGNELLPGRGNLVIAEEPHRHRM